VHGCGRFHHAASNEPRDGFASQMERVFSRRDVGWTLSKSACGVPQAFHVAKFTTTKNVRKPNLKTEVSARIAEESHTPLCQPLRSALIKFCCVFYSQLFFYPGAITIHGADFELELPGHFAGRQTATDQLKDFHFPI